MNPIYLAPGLVSADLNPPEIASAIADFRAKLTEAKDDLFVEAIVHNSPQQETTGALVAIHLHQAAMIAISLPLVSNAKFDRAAFMKHVEQSIDHAIAVVKGATGIDLGGRN